MNGYLVWYGFSNPAFVEAESYAAARAQITGALFAVRVIAFRRRLRLSGYQVL